jgi:hypothetical protein
MPSLSSPAEQIYEKTRNDLSQASQNILDFVINKHKNNDLMSALKKSKFWYNYSFGQMENRLEYLPYLSNDSFYQALQQKLDKINICFGDFKANLELLPDASHDLVYVSNIFDHKSYCADSEEYLTTIKNKLATNGLCLVATQESRETMIKLFSKQSFILAQEDVHCFNILDAVFSRLNYSFLLFKK